MSKYFNHTIFAILCLAILTLSACQLGPSQVRFVNYGTYNIIQGVRFAGAVHESALSNVGRGGDFTAYHYVNPGTYHLVEIKGDSGWSTFYSNTWMIEGGSSYTVYLTGSFFYGSISVEVIQD